jgi:hypothetical protein
MITDLSLSQRISLNLRLGQRLVLKYGKNQAAIGLRSHRDKTHRCHPTEFYKIDFVSDANTKDSHPHLYVKGCPALHFDPLLFAEINRAIEIEDLGGLHAYCGSVGTAHLPSRVVDFYQEVLAARDRFLAERDQVYGRLQS